jgi:hypothetical protein
MALVTYLIGSCAGGPAILVDFDSSSLPAVNGNYYLTFTGATEEGCYDIIDNAEPTEGVDSVSGALGTNYGDCQTCLAANPTPTPTPTPTVTPTVTPSVTPTTTRTPTPTVTSTRTPTPSITASATPTVTNTSSPTSTPTPSVTASITPTPSITPTNTLTPTVTTTNTPTPSITPTNTLTPTVTTTNTPTPSITPTKTSTPAPTSSPTPSVTPTITPSLTSIGTTYVNVQYEYTNQMEGSFSGGTWDASLGDVPHPQAYVEGTRGWVIDLSAVKLGGFNGLNN